MYIHTTSRRIISALNRNYSSNLKDKIKEIIPLRKEKYNKLKSLHGDIVIDNVSIDQVLGGMRGIKSMHWDVSNLDPEKGITFYNKTINDLRDELPKHFYPITEIEKTKKIIPKLSDEPMAESLLWFLLTGDIPTPIESLKLKDDLQNRPLLSENIKKMISQFPDNMHPMTQLSTVILLMQKESLFFKEYSKGLSKNNHWDYTYEDIMNIIAVLPEVCALIYTNKYKVKPLDVYNESSDLIGRFCQLMGFHDENFHDFMRLYMIIHCDHEGGNASAHTCRLVGSTLADPYLSLASSMNALAGPLHGLANQEVLKWLIDLQNKLNKEKKEVNPETITDFALNTLKEGKVIPGYGHAVLRQTDPRYLCQRDFAQKNFPDYELFKLVDTIYEVMPSILKDHGKVKNPYPNVDSHSGIMLKYYGLKEYEYYTVLFGLGRTFGVLSQLFWDRALNVPLERPKSLSLQKINDTVTKQLFEKSIKNII